MDQYIVTGMTCAACQNHVEKAVSKVPGIESVSVSLLTNSMAVEGTASADEIIKAVETAGYGAQPKGAKKNQGSGSSQMTVDEDVLKDRETPKLKRRLLMSVGFLVLLMYITMGHNILGWPIPGFLQHNHIGLAIIQMLIAIVVMVINVPLALMSAKYLGKRFLINSIKSIVITSVLLDVIAPPMIPIYTGSPFLAAVFNGILCGIGLALIFMRNSSTGGTDFVIMTINKLRPHMSVGAVTQVIDGIIILAGAFFFKNIDAVLYGIISVLILGIVMDRLMAGANTGKIAFIVSEKPQEIAEAIDQAVGRGSTLIKGKGSYTRTDKNIVFCACATKEMYKVKETVEAVDPKAFLVITDSREVYGEGFNPIIG